MKKFFLMKKIFTIQKVHFLMLVSVLVFAFSILNISFLKKL